MVGDIGGFYVFAAVMFESCAFLPNWRSPDWVSTKISTGSSYSEAPGSLKTTTGACIMTPCFLRDISNAQSVLD